MSLSARCAVAALIGLALGLPPASARDLDAPGQPEPPQVIADGLVLHQAVVGKGRLATYLRVDLEKFDVRVLSALLPRRDDKMQNQIQNAIPERAPQGFFLKDYRASHNAEAVLSGGYIASFSPPTPFGFIKSDGTVVSPPETSWLTDGYFCSEPGRAQIQRLTDLAAFRDCLQAGPVLLLRGQPPGAPLHSKKWPPEYEKLASTVQEQAFICTVAPNELILGITDKINLPALVDFLSGEEMGCIDAIRLTGEQTAGLVLGDQKFGHDDYLFPSVIAVVPRAP